MIRESIALHIGAKVFKTSQSAVQADGQSLLTITGETRLILHRGDKQFQLDALVVADLDVDVLAGVPFMETNDIAVRPAKQLIVFGDGSTFCYNPATTRIGPHAVRRAQSFVLRASPATPTTVWPGEFLEVSSPTGIPKDVYVAVEPRPDFGKSSRDWLLPDVVLNVDGKIRLPNVTTFPYTVARHDHFGQVLYTAEPEGASSLVLEPSARQITASRPTTDARIDTIRLDPDGIMPPSIKTQFIDLHR